MSKLKYELAILGAGITGSFAAYIASKYGLKTVVIDKSINPDGATSKSGGIVTRMLDNLNDAVLALKSLNLIYEVCRDCKDVIHKGCLCIEDIESAEEDLEKFRKLIPDLKLLYPSDILNKWDYVKLYNDEVGLYSESDLTVEPDRLLSIVWSRSMDLGAEFKLGIEASGLNILNGRIESIELSNGEVLKSDNVLIALGAWSKSFLKKYRVKVKTFLLAVPLFKFDIGLSNLIGLWDEEMYSYWRPSLGNTFIGGGYDAYRISNPEDGFRKPYPDSISYVIELLKFRFKFKRWRLIDQWCGPISISYSYHPIYGRVKKFENLYLIDGLGGYGLVRGPALASEVLNMIIG